MAAPIMGSDKITGFLCVNNPVKNTGDILLLSVAVAVCYREASNRRREDAKLEKTEKEMNDRVNQGLADQKKLHEANENLTILLAEEKQYTAIIGALSNVYFGLFYIDLEKNTFQELFSQDKIHHTLGEKGNAREALKHMTNALVGDAYQPLMLQLTDFDTLDERLGDKPIIVQEYTSRTGGWTQCSFIPVERDENGKNRTVMCTLRSVTVEKEVESQGNLIQALAIPYENIYTVNADTCEAIYYCMGQTMTERYGYKFAAGNYEYNIQTYIENDVLEEDWYLFDQVRTVDGVNELLADKKTYYFNYRVQRNHLTQYFQCQLVKPNPLRNEFVVGFKDINEEKLPIEGLGSEYYSVLLVNPNTDEVTVYRAEETEGRAVAEYFLRYDNSWSKGILAYFEELITDASRGEFLEKLSLKHIQADGKEYSFTYEKLTDGGIIGMTAIAAAHIDDKERVQDCLKKTTQASKHLLSLINEVLDMSKIESGKVDLVEEFSFSDLIDNLLTMTNGQIAEHHHELSVNISGVTHEAVVGDSLRIQKVFTNLMSNAVKYTPDGGKIKLSISEKPCNQARVGCYEVVFEDNGIGMSEEFQGRIFEPFTRAADNNHVNKIQGTGLGMAISRNIVRMMGGDIKVESKLGVGSRFTVTMYLKRQDAVVVQYDKFVALETIDLKGSRALLVEDNELNAEIAREILKMTGLTVEHASDGVEAVDKMAECEDGYYDMVFMDIQMPRMNGYDAARAIRAMDRRYCKQVPIVAMTANAFAEDVHAAKTAGMNDHIAKPLDLNTLAKILKKWI